MLFWKCVEIRINISLSYSFYSNKECVFVAVITTSVSSSIVWFASEAPSLSPCLGVGSLSPKCHSLTVQSTTLCSTVASRGSFWNNSGGMCLVTAFAKLSVCLSPLARASMSSPSSRYQVITNPNITL